MSASALRQTVDEADSSAVVEGMCEGVLLVAKTRYARKLGSVMHHTNSTSKLLASSGVNPFSRRKARLAGPSSWAT